MGRGALEMLRAKCSLCSVLCSCSFLVSPSSCPVPFHSLVPFVSPVYQILSCHRPGFGYHCLYNFWDPGQII